jgi:3-oxoacyl-[acyl-carrier-protein] synthase-3
MAIFQVDKVTVKGISACVPKSSEEVRDLPLFTEEDVEKFISGTGVERRRIASAQITTSDLCFHAATQIMEDLNWSHEDIDCLIFVTQTPDFILPATACILQQRLGLRQEILAYDISLGCSGWIYGLMSISNLISTGNFKKGLLLVGDTISKICSPTDKSTLPLFGDAGTATALEYDEHSSGIKFHVAVDGSGSEAIIIQDGAFRHPYNYESSIVQQFEEGIERAPIHLFLDGMNVFAFGINKAPESVNKLINHFNLASDTIDFFIFHQANLFMNEKIRKKLKLPIEKVPYSLRNFGNTSSATIPLTIVVELTNILKKDSHTIAACGFGVGLSWGTAIFEVNNFICSDLVEI